MSETVAEMTDERLIEHIAGMVCVGWRKGVDGYGSAKIYNTINGGAWKSDDRIQEMVNSNVLAIAHAAAPLIRRNAPSAEIGAAIKEAACVSVPLPEGADSIEITPEGMGVAMFRALTPIEYTHYGKHRIVAVSDEYNRHEMREQDPRRNGEPDYERGEDENWTNRGYVGQDAQVYVGVALCKLVEEIPAVREYFAHVLNQNFVTQFQKELLEANQEVEDGGWRMLANWFKYCLDMKED